MQGGGFTNGSFLDEYRDALHRAAAAKASLENLERRRKRTYAELVSTSDGPVSKSEYAAECHPSVVDLDGEIEKARIEAGSAEAEVTYLSARMEVWRTRSASYREQMKHGAR